MENISLGKGQEPNFGDYFLQKQVEVMIEINTKRLSHEINDLKNALQALQMEVSVLKKDMQDNKTNMSQPRVERVMTNQDYSNPQPMQPASTAQPMTQSVQRPQDQSVKPRYGDYKPSDVPIEKFFYFGGNKRR
ncbi:hypothetical protein HYW21_07305 [Candidatus Woesearchaeota archaeon]|nr:hypothetical protein [Candidatus Woesearchaeota archaeon]